MVDCANGATYHVAPAVFHELGAEAIPLADDPNGLNINADCGSLHPKGLRPPCVSTMRTPASPLTGMVTA